MNRQPKTPRLALLAAAALAFPLAARADVLTITDSADATIFAKKPTGITNPTPDQYLDTGNASGKGPALFAGADGSSNIKRSLLRFDLSTIPAGATISSATLTLHLAQVAGSGGGSSSNITTDRLFGLYPNLQPWTEGPSGATTSAGVGGTGQGAPAQNGDVTWSDATFNTNPALATPWNNSGGNFAATESDQLDVPLGTTLAINQPLTFQSSAGLVADLQNWLDNPAANDGWLLKSDNLELTPTSFLGFWTRDALAEGNTSAIAPFLTITFTPPAGTAVPEPASLGLLALVAPAMLIRRRSSSRSKPA